MSNIRQAVRDRMKSVDVIDLVPLAVASVALGLAVAATINAHTTNETIRYMLKTQEILIDR